ncbi:GntR family transcriptional regulator [Acidisoma cellulosilytica]|uniref:GntR family transcriptional regulator n=1 Tax=Acidisoma cellulosilyticum TaxID=2802395 RepID=A0A963Z6N2_9PROT|nr:GntR family transcriptional regulator [Acidisoma cellulosilyticum]MCB8883795.1 GntR family transcriptional regulator [Acidisoma cellulosilyticum]
MLRDALTEGSFRPGERIIIHELATKLGTSVTPVREACLRLVSERGLELRSGRFVTVPDLTLERYMEIRTIRLALEGLAVELAAGLAEEADIESLTEIQRKFEAAREKKDFASENKLNRDFHLGVYRLSRMSILVNHIESLWVSMGPILKVYHEEINADASIPDRHTALIASLKVRDAVRARAALEQDLTEGGTGILRYLNAL